MNWIFVESFLEVLKIEDAMNQIKTKYFKMSFQDFISFKKIKFWRWRITYFYWETKFEKSLTSWADAVNIFVINQ